MFSADGQDRSLAFPEAVLSKAALLGHAGNRGREVTNVLTLQVGNVHRNYAIPIVAHPGAEVR